ncbi:hypothetical protein [Paenibacillus aceti]|uniref:Uncharacterized protein n=1 Tax=Paenibacillus aceti TaxID=1820010 RepID=A0ABQ1W916_9BACL|nr:hypothetical protein [Paenibacillus aceti]GGG19756.1 hypothetical protein GCM10010913_47380 [Paenibacillus aceti]
MYNVRLNSIEQLVFFMDTKGMVSIEYGEEIETGLIELVTEELIKVNGIYFFWEYCNIYFSLTSSCKSER